MSVLASFIGSKICLSLLAVVAAAADFDNCYHVNQMHSAAEAVVGNYYPAAAARLSPLRVLPSKS